MDSILAVDREPNLAFQGILHSVFHRLEAGEGVAIAFTSATAGEGVTYVSKKIASQFSASSSVALHLSSTQLCRDSWQDGAKRLDGYKINDETGSRTAWEDWRSKVSKLRARYRYSLIDCPRFQPVAMRSAWRRTWMESWWWWPRTTPISRKLRMWNGRSIWSTARFLDSC